LLLTQLRFVELGRLWRVAKKKEQKDTSKEILFGFKKTKFILAV
jgi:hypothetical protein